MRALRNLAESRYRAHLDIAGMRFALRAAVNRKQQPKPKLTLRAKLERELVRLVFRKRLRRPRRATGKIGSSPAPQAAFRPFRPASMARPLGAKPIAGRAS